MEKGSLEQVKYGWDEATNQHVAQVIPQEFSVNPDDAVEPEEAVVVADSTESEAPAAQDDAPTEAPPESATTEAEEPAAAENTQDDAPTDENEAPEEADTTTQEVIDDFFKVEAHNMVESGELAEDFPIDEATPDLIKKGWRDKNFVPIYQEATSLAINTAHKQLQDNYDAETLDLAFRLKNNVTQSEVDTLLAYKEAAEVDVSKMDLDEKIDYSRQYLADKELDKETIDLTIAAAEEGGSIDKLTENGKAYFTDIHKNMDADTKTRAQTASQAKQQRLLEDQHWTNQVLQSGKLGERELTPTELNNLKKGVLDRTIDLKNGQKATSFEVFENELLNNYKVRMLAFDLLLNWNSIDEGKQQEMVNAAENKAARIWGPSKKIATPAKPKAKATNKSNNQEPSATYVYKSDGTSEIRTS